MFYMRIHAVEEMGPKAAAATKLMRPELADQLDGYISDLNKIHEEDSLANDTEWYKAIDRVMKLVETGVISREEAYEHLKIDKSKDITQFKIHGKEQVDPEMLANPKAKKK